MALLSRKIMGRRNVNRKLPPLIAQF